ncbi:MAG: hypothetical protein QOC73_1728, partial [Actinomycetota bacterium]|nr:hypothetical protein [Actinomycetota bacterium]
AGFGATAQIDQDLVEWNYGDYEGRRTAEILKDRPGWKLFNDGCPGGESPADVGARADRVVARVLPVLQSGDVAVVSHGHFLRVLAARWLGLPAAQGALLALDTGSVSALGFEHAQPVVRLWNDQPSTRTSR